MKSSNEKLKGRSLRILAAEIGIESERAQRILDEANGDLRVALVMAKASVDRDSAEEALQKSGFVVEKALEIAVAK